jgi:cellobiose phosphorylase
MTDSPADTVVLTCQGMLPVPLLTSASVSATGSLEQLVVDGRSVLLYPASPMSDGAAGLWLRRRTDVGVEFISLVGQQALTEPDIDGQSPADRSGQWGDLDVQVRFRLSERQPAWFWHVSVTNSGRDQVKLDLVHAQDVALAPLGAVRTNEYYVSQYLDLTPVPVQGHGVALGVRQNMPGDTPWLLLGCLGQADRWATDAIQLTGRGRPEGAPWPGLSGELPSVRRQGEHSLAALQTRPTLLEPGQTWTSGFYGFYVADHPEATSAEDQRYALAALADSAAQTPASGGDGPPPERQRGRTGGELVGPDHRSLFGQSRTMSCRALTEDELDGLVGRDRRDVEREGEELLSFFTGDGAQLVTAAKQARVLRPHGHLFRSGTSLLPDESSVCATVWMDGTFCSQLTQGHVSLGTIVSLRRSYLGLAPAHGLRLFVRAPGVEDWTLLGTPSAWSVSLEECRWWYAGVAPSTGSGSGAGSRDLLVLVTTRVRPESDEVEVEVTVLGGPPVEILAAAHVSWLDPDGPIGSVAPEPDGARIEPPEGSSTAELYPGGALHLGWTAGSAELGDDGPLFLDGHSRRLPWVTLRTEARRDWRLVLTPELVQADPVRKRRSDFWPATAGAVTLQPPDTAAGREQGRIGTALPWFTHDAVVHYLSPRGLEQYSGGAWGTRDVSQGPVGLLLALGAHDELRALILLILRAQFTEGDWPQAFDFLERHRNDGPSDSHGDVVYWPLLALGQYLAATGDGSILDEQVGFAGGGSGSVVEHVRAALDHVGSTLIGGTSLPAYGHGDWNDSLQPVDPALAARMCSTWTGVLQSHALGVLGAELGRFMATEELGQRATEVSEAGAADVRRLLLVDGVLAGYGLFGEGPSSGGVEVLIHPQDRRTGLRYSILAMIHAISSDLLMPTEAKAHLRLIEEHLLGPDGARLFDRPVDYRGGPMTLFQRAEASTFFGREIGIMYMHAHLRYAEALAQPVGMTDRVPSARPRQSTCYYSSSDAAFDDRYAARDHYADIVDGTVPLEGGWRVYSSGPGLFLQLLVQHQLGLRIHGDRVHLDPVLDPELDGLVVRVPLLGATRTFRFSVGRKGHGVRSVQVNGAALQTEPLPNPYRAGGVSVSANELRRALDLDDAVANIETG